jgi:hypothetical protein
MYGLQGQDIYHQSESCMVKVNLDVDSVVDKSYLLSYQQ